MMNEAIIRIASGDDTILAEASSRFKKAWKTGKAQPAVFTFSTPAQLFSVISPKRWQLIVKLQHLGPSTIQGLARELERDVKRVHDDVTALLEWGIVERDEEGLVHVPFSVIHAAFDLKAVASEADTVSEMGSVPNLRPVASLKTVVNDLYGNLSDMKNSSADHVPYLPPCLTLGVQSTSLCL
jgi:predicted transcriptional regulator